jgi:hypothetical protein
MTNKMTLMVVLAAAGNVKAALLVTVLLALGGCASEMSRGTLRAEATWQALNVIDTGQTITTARNPTRFAEDSFPTQLLIGAHPTSRDVYVTMAAFAVVHYGVTWLLDSRDDGNSKVWHTANIAWQALTLGDKAYNVVNNFSHGDGMWEGRHPPQYCNGQLCQ